MSLELIGTGFVRTARTPVAQHRCRYHRNAVQRDAVRCAANATDLIELIALQTRNKASGGYQGGTCACSSFAPSQHAAAVGTFKLFALPAYQISLPQTRGSKTTPLCSLSPHRAILLPLIIPSIHRSPPHSLPHQPLITPKHQQHQQFRKYSFFIHYVSYL